MAGIARPHRRIRRARLWASPRPWGRPSPPCRTSSGSSFSAPWRRQQRRTVRRVWWKGAWSRERRTQRCWLVWASRPAQLAIGRFAPALRLARPPRWWGSSSVVARGTMDRRHCPRHQLVSPVQIQCQSLASGWQLPPRFSPPSRSRSALGGCRRSKGCESSFC